MCIFFKHIFVSWVTNQLAVGFWRDQRPALRPSRRCRQVSHHLAKVPELSEEPQAGKKKKGLGLEVVWCGIIKSPTRWWFQIFFIFIPTWKISNLTNIFQMG